MSVRRVEKMIALGLPLVSSVAGWWHALLWARTTGGIGQVVVDGAPGRALATRTSER